MAREENAKGEPAEGVTRVGAVGQKESGPEPGIIPRCHQLQPCVLCCTKAGFLLLCFVELSFIYLLVILLIFSWQSSLL